MPLKAPTISTRDLSVAAPPPPKTVPREIVAGPKIVIRPEIIGIIIRERMELKEALQTATAISKGVSANIRQNPALKGLSASEPGLLVTGKGILAGFFPGNGPTFEL
jgi:hypothetical protein